MKEKINVFNIETNWVFVLNVDGYGGIVSKA